MPEAGEAYTDQVIVPYFPGQSQAFLPQGRPPSVVALLVDRQDAQKVENVVLLKRRCGVSFRLKFFDHLQVLSQQCPCSLVVALLRRYHSQAVEGGRYVPLVAQLSGERKHL